MRIPFRLVDVFADAPFGGNQLCVVPDTPAELTTETMQALALEIGFSETTFVTAVRPDGYDVRIFTPEEELPFAGHPTLGTAFALAREGLIRPQALQRCAAGEIPVTIDVGAGTASMRQLAPEVGREVDDRDAVAAAAGLERDDLVDTLPIVPISTGIPHTMVPVRDDAALRRAVRDERRCAEVSRSSRLQAEIRRRPPRADVRQGNDDRRGPGDRLGGGAARRVSRAARRHGDAGIGSRRAGGAGGQAVVPPRPRRS